jgi:hypothetical protein
MDSFWQKINNDLKQAMRDKAELKLSVLRLLVSAIGYKKIALGKGTGPDPLTDNEIIEVVASEIKKRKDSVVSYEAGARQDLADKEKAEIEILFKYLPTQFSDEEIEKEVRAVISGLGEIKPTDFGRVMGQVMAKLKGRVEGGKVTEIVKKILAG